MVTYEGEGVTAPKPVIVTMTREEMRLIGDEARRREKFRKYAKRKDSWGKGLMKGELVKELGEMPAAAWPIAVGLMGEYAVIRRFNGAFPDLCLSLDLDMKADGDKGVDLAPFGYPLQVKTRRISNTKNLIQAVNEHGRRMKLTAKAYIFSEWSRGREVHILGWVPKENAIKWNKEHSPVGGHINLVGRDYQLRPFGRLLAQVEAFKTIVAGK